MAQNIVLSWLGGGRLFELKTVQVLDDLEIGRPCIDMETVGYNIEWSQELTVPQSLEEYVKAWMAIEILRRWEPLADFVGPDPGPHVFDMSVGYDLDGIRTDKVASFIRGMRDASASIDALRSELTGPFAEFADLDFPSAVSDTLTLSTFHGCPPDEIEAITKHLIDEHDLDVIVKLNPTLLGYERVAALVNDELGYGDISVKEAAFAEDLQFDRGVELIDELNAYAKDRGHRFGIKLTNTLVVDNTRGFMPDDTMYLSGPPLHVISTTLLDRLADALPGRFAIPGHDGDVMVSFSAGVTKANLSDTVATGLNPATICSDLLKPGGYGRLAPMLRGLADELRAKDCADLASYRTARQAEAEASGHGSVVAAYVAHLHGDGGAPYALAANEKLPRSVDNDLEMFGCVRLQLLHHRLPQRCLLQHPKPRRMPDRQQYLVLSELCNECGNCMVFCPERGDPAMIKPRLYTDPTVFAGRDGQGFLLSETGQVTEARADDDAVAWVRQLLAAEQGLPLQEVES